jgi:Chaperone for flagella basal body P-ring formation
MCRGFDGRAARCAQRSHRFSRLLGLARSLQMYALMLALYLPLSAAAVAAQDRVLLHEVMPELSGTPLGAVDVVPAPLPGSSVTIRRSDVLRALNQAGLSDSAKGLSIPRSTRVTRVVSNLSREVFAAEALAAVTEATTPCELREARYPSEVRLAGGPRNFRAEFPGSLRSGSLTGGVFVESGGRTVRVPVVVNLSCPPPEISAGAQVTAVVVVGPVRATAPAEARQPGRRGEIIRLVNRATGASLRGRVLDGHTVEVIQ